MTNGPGRKSQRTNNLKGELMDENGQVTKVVDIIAPIEYYGW